MPYDGDVNMEDEDDEPHYEVERILAQKPGENGQMLHLVKWKNYQDEECTWEPKENFDRCPDILADWKKQWASGDVLDDETIARVQEKMDAFQARTEQAAESDDDFEEPVIETDHPQPRKMSSIVHNSVLLPNKASAKKGTTKRINHRSPSPQRPTTKPRIHRNVNENTRPPTLKSVKKASAPLHRPRSPPAALSPLNTSNPSRPTVSNQAGPAEFYAPDLSQRQRRNSNKESNARKEPAGKQFKSLRHQNNARKKLMAAAPPNPLVPQRSLSLNEQGKSINQATKTNDHAVSLFFDDSGEEDIKAEPGDEMAVELLDTDIRCYTCHVGQRKCDNIRPKCSTCAKEKKNCRGYDMTREEAKELEQQRRKEKTTDSKSRSTSGVNSNISSDDEPLIKRVTLERNQNIGKDAADASLHGVVEPRASTSLPPRGANAPISRRASQPGTFNKEFEPTGSRSTLHTETQSSAYATRGATPAHIVAPTAGDAITSTTSGGVAQGHAQAPSNEPPRQRRNSLFNRELPSGLTSPAGPSDATSSVTPRQPSARRPFAPMGATTAPMQASSTSIPVAIQNRVDRTMPKTKFARVDDVQREYGGNDIILHLSFQGQEIVVKGIHIDWEHRKKLIQSKQGSNKVLLRFDRFLNRQQYDQASQKIGFSYTDLGTVEPWSDNEEQLRYLALYLEQHDAATFWDHPVDNMMLVMYSCKAQSWRDMGQKPGRDYGSHLQIAFRQKFEGAALTYLREALESADQSDSSRQVEVLKYSTIDSRDDDRRGRGSRRNSLVSNLNTTPTVPDPRRKDSLLTPTSERRSEPADIIQQSPHRVNEDIPMAMSPVQQEISDDSSMAMDVDKRDDQARQPSTTPITSGAYKEESVASKKDFPGLDKALDEIVLSKSASSKMKFSDVYVILCYKKATSERVQSLKKWFIDRGVPWDHIYDVNEKDDWQKFLQDFYKTIGVVLFDKYYPLTTSTRLSQAITEKPNLICWRLDYQATTVRPLSMKKLFPTGTALTICESTFVNEPKYVLRILRWFYGYVKAKNTVAAIMLPPSIGTIVLQQASQAKIPENQALFVEIWKQTQELIELGSQSRVEDDDSGIGSPEEPRSNMAFSVIQPSWEAVYKDMPQEQQLQAYELSQLNNKKELLLFVYFSAWALRHLEQYRKFTAIRASPNRPPKSEHVRFLNAQVFLKHLSPEKSSTAKDKDRNNENERGRSSSKAQQEVDTAMRDASRSRSRPGQTPTWQSPAFRSPAFGA